MRELLPHKADLATLEVIGHAASRRKSQQKNDVGVHIHGKGHEHEMEYATEITDNVQMEDDDDNGKEDENMGGSLDNRPDIVDPSLMGKCEWARAAIRNARNAFRSGLENR